MFPPDKSSGQRVQDVHISLACIGFLPESIIAEMLTHAKAEQRDFRHAVLSKPYKPVLCATTRGALFFLPGNGEFSRWAALVHFRGIGHFDGIAESKAGKT